MPVRLFVGNLPYDTTETELRDFFSSVGPLTAVIIPVDRETGKRRGFAFVEFKDQSQAAEAGSRLNNQPFKGRPVTINEARGRENRSDSNTAQRPAQRAAQRPAPRPGFTPAPKPSLGTPEFAPDIVDNARTARAENRRRNFGADAKPAHKRKNLYGNKGEMGGRKGQIRERGGGQIFGDEDDDDVNYDYLADFRNFDEE